MGRSCCVPGCKSNYGVTDTSAFRFPRDEVLRKKWVMCIHRDDFVVTDNSLVCINHFEDKFIVREDVFPIVGDKPITVPRKKPKLRDDAYPTIFQHQPSYHTVKVPKDRTSPASRLERLLEKDEDDFRHWCDSDVISNFESFKSEVMERNVKPFILVSNEDFVLFLKVKDTTPTDIPLVTISFKVTSDLSVKVFYRNMCLPPENFKWILESEGQDDLKCNRWSKFDNLVSHLGNYGDTSFDISERVTLLINFVKESLDSNSFDAERVTKIKFCLEQLELSAMKQTRYSPELLIWAATFSYLFPGAYQRIRETNVLYLPHHVYLKQFLGKMGPITPGIGPSHRAFLEEKCKLLQSEDKVVSVMLDEIYLNSKVTYKAGRVLGMTGNGVDIDTASTMQVFMASSLHSKNKDVIALFPVKNMQADTLHTLTTEILRVMNELGFHVICLVSDNNRVNRRMFEILCGGSLKNSIPNPASPSKPLFLLFDSVHILKCIRNNWLNRCNETFTVPNVEEVFPVLDNLSNANENSARICQYTTVEAKFSDLKNLFQSEKNLLLKLAPTLSRKVLYPTSLERQNVSLAVNLFNHKNIVALETLKSQGIDISDGTIQFLTLFTKWWTICNVKHPMKGVYTRNIDASPICGVSDTKLQFLENLKTYLDVWHLSDVEGKLSNETYIAMTHTLGSITELCKYVFNTYNWTYILTAKLQTDSLEGRFGAYRRLSGCSYSVSAEQVLESERKLKVLGLLKLKSSQFGDFKLSDFAMTVEKGFKETVADNLQCLEPAINELSNVHISLETQKILVCIASYTSKKVIEKLNLRRSCDECQLTIQSREEMQLVCDKDILSYFTELNRGGLKCPTPFMITLCSNVYALFQILISKVYELQFMKLNNQQDAIVTLGTQICEMNVNDLDKLCECGVSLKTIVKKSVKVLSNIFLNNYTKLLNERKTSKELAKKLAGKKKNNTSDHELGDKVRKRKEMKFSK